jgi:dynein heavy chain
VLLLLQVVSLITLEVHARDVIEKLAKAGCSSTNDFEWVSQLRFYWDRELNDCVVKQVLSVFMYGYEYQGNNGRLVITPLTDRCGHLLNSTGMQWCAERMR